MIPALLQLASGALRDFDAPTFRAYRDALVWESKTQDVLEQLLVEQVAMAHIASFNFQACAATTASPEAVGIYAGVAVKLMGEMRRTIVAIKELRTPPAPPNITFSASQLVSVTKDETPSPDRTSSEKTGLQSELGGKHEPGHNRLHEILRASAGRPAHRETAEAVE
jgi:hypothetical protein